ncbi:MAG: hypothetical protein HKO66_13125 [Saprospiraceae bacterium]|nr:hypothetical protein [Bacteroidia bacterium]NNE14229.1 hypothetical protein [Saprospiraceae bacterium]NNL93175.1 hypothetical protein [Saprospiraceae bacterium]
MSKQQFIKILLFSGASCVLLFFLTSLLIEISAYKDFLIFSIILFSVLSVGTYLLGENAIKSKDGSAFIRIVIMNVFLKLVGSFVFVLAYAKLAKPADKMFLIPFLICYLVYLISETYFLNIQARQTKANP